MKEAKTSKSITPQNIHQITVSIKKKILITKSIIYLCLQKLMSKNLIQKKEYKNENIN